MGDGELHVWKPERCFFCKDSDKALGAHDVPKSEEYVPLQVGKMSPKEQTLFDENQAQFLHDIEKKADDFLRQKYPAVLNRLAEGNGPIFIDRNVSSKNFSSSYPIVLDYDNYTNVTTGEPLSGLPSKGKIIGEELEFKLFKQAKDFFTSGETSEKDLLVIRDYPWYEEKNPAENKEEKRGVPATSEEAEAAAPSAKNKKVVPDIFQADLLVVSGSRKMILQIECKATARQSTSNDSRGQHLRLRNHLKQKFHFYDGWKHVKALALNQPDKHIVICTSCSNFKVQPASEQQGHSFADLWHHVAKVCPAATEYDRQGYIEVFRCLTFYPHHDFKSADPDSKLKTALDTASKPDNIIRWTEAPYSTPHLTERRKVLLASTFGTGKTILLRHTAKMVAKAMPRNQGSEPPPVIFLVLPSTPYYMEEETLLMKQTRLEFENQSCRNTKVRVTTWKDVVKEVRTTNPAITKRHEILSCFLRKNKSSPGIFIDEFSSHFIISPEKEEFKPYSFHSIVTFLLKQPENFWPEVKEIVGDYLNVIAMVIRMVFSQHISYDYQEIINASIAFQSSGDNHARDLLRFLVVIEYVVADQCSSGVIEEHIDVFRDCHDWIRGKELIDKLKEHGMTFEEPAMDDLMLARDRDWLHDCLYSLAESVDRDTFLWIAINKNDADYRRSYSKQTREPRAFWREGLPYNLRSTANIVRQAKKDRIDEAVDCLEVSHREGSEPLVNEIDVSTLDGTQIGKALFWKFKEALESLPSSDNVLVTWDPLIGQAQRELLRLIKDYCMQRDKPIPVYVGMQMYLKPGEDGFENAIKWNRKKKGILIADMNAVQGCEFTSVIAFCPIYTDGKGDERIAGFGSFGGLRFITDADVMLRAACNLAIIKYKEKENAIRTCLAKFQDLGIIYYHGTKVGQSLVIL